MAGISLTALRKQLFKMADEVLETGVPLEIERHGKTLRLSVVEQEHSLIDRLTNHPIIEASALNELEEGHWEWNEEKNL